MWATAAILAEHQRRSWATHFAAPFAVALPSDTFHGGAASGGDGASGAPDTGVAVGGAGDHALPLHIFRRGSWRSCDGGYSFGCVKRGLSHVTCHL